MSIVTSIDAAVAATRLHIGFHGVGGAAFISTTHKVDG
jgi:hypothetical protein